jgi:hypothetical protein
MKTFNEFKLDEGINKDDPIAKEYSALMKKSIGDLRAMIKQQKKVVDVSGYTSKDQAASEILRAKHGNKKVAAAMGLDEGIMGKLKSFKRGMDARSKAADHFDKAGDPKNPNASKDLRRAVKYHNVVNKEETEMSEGENKQIKGGDPCWKGYQMVGMKPGKGGKKVPNCVPANEGLKPGWMLKADPKLGAAVKAKQDMAKKRQATYGNPAAGKSAVKAKQGVAEEVEQIDELSNKTLSSYSSKAKDDARNLMHKAYKAQVIAGTTTSLSTMKKKDKESDDAMDKRDKRLTGVKSADKRMKTVAGKSAVKESLKSDVKALRTMIEEASYKVDVEGLPTMYVQSKSPTEVRTNLRKLLKKADMILSVDRIPDVEVKKAFRLKAMGKDEE